MYCRAVKRSRRYFEDVMMDSYQAKMSYEIGLNPVKEGFYNTGVLYPKYVVHPIYILPYREQALTESAK
jgi:hypothetical protein